MSMYGRDPWGGPLEINAADSATEDERSRNLNDYDRAALSNSRPLDETQQSWLLGQGEQKKKKKYVDLGCIIVSRKIFVWTVGTILVCGFLAGLITLIVKTVPRHHRAHAPPDNYTLALHKALMFFNAQRSGKLPKHNNVSWRGNSCLQDGKSDKSTTFKDLVGGYYDAGDAIKFNFPASFAMTMLSWSVIEYSAKYEAAGELNHIKEIIKWGTDYFLKTFNSSADTINSVAAQVGLGDTSGGSTSANDHYCWMRPEDIDYDRPVYECHSCSDLAAEMAAALASASIVFKDNKAYSQKLVHGAKTLFQFSRQQRGRYSAGGSDAALFYNSSSYWDEFIWGGAWLYYATGNSSYLSLATTTGLARHAGAFWGGPDYGVLSWDNKLAGAQVLLSRLRLFLSPGYPYEEMLRTFHNQTSIIMCSYLPVFTSFNRTKGGLIQLNHGRPQPLQYVVNAAFLATVFSDYLDAADTPGWYCGPNFYSTDVLRDFAKKQIDYILGKNPRKMSYIVGFGERYPRRPHHRGASIPKNKVKYNCKGGWKWRDTSKPNPNTLAGAMVPKMGSSLSITMCRGGATPAFKMGSPTSRRRLRIRSVLERLEDPSTRAEARVFLSDLQGRLDSQQSPEQCFDRFHFRIEQIFLDQYEATHDGNRTDQLGYQGRKKLTMMIIPSIFIPEDWSFTFYEGLNRHQDSIFKDKSVAELGCGNGWITIAIAAKWSPMKVYGLDINPRAVKISWINLYLNALDERGLPISDSEGKTLLDRVEFHESDLLSYCRDHDLKLERIVGCIPQILNPNPDAMSKMITENASEEFLYSLSNYCALQGFVEDQFGLGLIARAVEEGIAVIKPAGIMIFNMGGRPGQAVCRRLFERRGFRINKLWQTKVLQAADTDISALVEIEKNSPHRFEFFMGLASDQPICARTAWAYGRAGGRISHALSVYSCQLRQPNEVKTIFEFLKNGFHDVSSSLDLSFEDDSVADEKIPFLAYLASALKESSYFPYEPPAGSKRFRNLIAGFMKTYHHIPLNADNIVVFPTRTAAIENALRLFSPRLAIVDQHLTLNLPRTWLTSLVMEDAQAKDPSEDEITVIEAPHRSDLMIELIKKLKPQVVITGMAHFESVTTSAFQHLLDVTKDIGSRLFLDISEHFELSSLPASNGVLKYLAGNPLPAHAAIICGLVKNQVYKDLEVAFVISEELSIFKVLSKTVELLEGSTAAMSQNYYGCLFHELLAFQLADRRRHSERQAQKPKSVDTIGIANSAISVLNDSELSVGEDQGSSLIHMDVDQSFLHVPSPVKAAIFESFARQNMSEAELDVGSSIRQHIKSEYGFPVDSSTELIYADSSLSLFNKLVLCCIQEGGTLCFPAGSNGNYISAAKFLKANVVTVPTQSAEGFKLTEKSLIEVLETLKQPWVYICGPTISPTGLLYSNHEIEKILSACGKFGAKVIIDTSFSGLEFGSDGWGSWDLTNSLSKLNSSQNPAFSVYLLGGLSFKLLTGALKFGFLVVNQLNMVDMFHSFPGLSKPHGTVKYAIKKLLGLRERKTGELMDAVANHIEMLKSRSKRLKETLEENGWDVLEPCAGLSMVAKPSACLGKTISIEPPALKDGVGTEEGSSRDVKIDDSNIREALVRSTGLCINSSSWTGIPGYCRFMMALDDNEFDQALACIVKFRSAIGS